jgi:hypothetical protein
LVCGAPVGYLPAAVPQTCAFCGQTFTTAAAQCRQGHFVCDACHTQDAASLVEHLCAVTSKTDMVELLQEIRRHPAIPLHGPEHHFMVPGIILAAYRNLGGEVPAARLSQALKWGRTVPGGSCAFAGVCGAALGVGIAFGILLGANPLKPRERQHVQQVVQVVSQEQARLAAARCCQRDSWLALRQAAVLSRTYLPVALRADFPLRCRQAHLNKECLGRACPLWQD